VAGRSDGHPDARRPDSGLKQRAAQYCPAERRSSAAISSFVQAQLDSGRFPHLKALRGDDSLPTLGERIIAMSTDEERFEHGLAAVLAWNALQFDSVPSDVNR
jgi:hypothetical protein